MKKQINLPVTKIEQYKTFEEIQYLTGYPRQYRFDAKKGVFNIKGGSNLTREGERFTIIPIAYRMFVDAIIERYYGRRIWAEFFFLNNQGQVCALLMHGHSVENLRKLGAQLYYEKTSLTEVALTIHPQKKQHSKGDYYIADFAIKALTKKAAEVHQAIVNTLPPIYRSETHTEDAEMIDERNYSAPCTTTPAIENEVTEAEPAVAVA